MKMLPTLLALLPLTLTAHAENQRQQEFQAEHNRQIRAFNHKDVAGFMAHYAPSLTVQPAHGDKLDYAAWKGFITAIVPGVRKVITHRHQVMGCTPVGKEWRVRIKETEEYAIRDTAALFGKKDAPHHLSNHSVYEEIWTMTPQGWRVRALTILEEKQVVDGHPFPSTP